MAQVGIKELKAHTSDLLRRVANDRETVDVTRGQDVIARLIPSGTVMDVTDEEIEQYFKELDTLIAEIAKEAPRGVSALDVIADIRRDPW